MTMTDRMVRIFARMQSINEKRAFYAIRNGFIAIMPAMIIGAFASVFTSMPLPAYQNFMEGVFGTRWKLLGELAYYGTTQIVTLLMVLAICINLAGWHNRHRIILVREGICGMVGLGCYVIVALPLGAEGLPFGMVGVSGMFIGMVVAVTASELFATLSYMGKGTKYTASDDPSFAVPQSFNAVVPAAVTTMVFVVVRLVFVGMGFDEGLDTLLDELLVMPFIGATDTIGTGHLYNFASHFMWLFGIHGTNVLDDVASNIFVAADLENIAAVAAGAPAPNLMTKTVFDAFVWLGGAGATMALLIAMMVFGRRKSYRQMFRYAVPTAIFNINEPVIYGIPIVLNPVFALPFLLVPVVLLGTTTLAMGFGLVPYTIAKVGWSTPIFISGWLATGSVAGVVLQAVNLGIAVLIWAPFVKVNEQLMDARFKSSYQQLCDHVLNEYDRSQRIIRRVDEIGAVARRLASDLGTAMREGSLYLVYQPIVDARDNSLHSVEALLRWNDKHHGFINPMVTVALAEEVGRMNDLGLWIMEEAIRQRAEWTKQGIPDMHVSVNVATCQLEDTRFHRRVEKLLEEYGVPPHQLQIEITETAALIDSQATKDNLELLAAMGVTLAMDDFGVGHSSLMYLRTQPISTLKVDASLSMDIVKNASSLNIVITIRELCKLLEVETIVEHVDDEKQLELLMEVDAYLIQGYWFSKPLPADELAGFMVGLPRRKLVGPKRL